MAQTDIDSAIASNLKNTLTDYSVDQQDTEAPDGTKPFWYQLSEWSEYLGYYKSIPELQTAVDAKANWVSGAGYIADPITALLLSAIKGNGKDTFGSILNNIVRTYTIAGDSYTEIIRDEEGVLANLKPLDPSTIRIVANSKGRIINYQQTDKNRKPMKLFKPSEMLHLSRKRVADEIHGISVIPSVKWIIDARNEAMTDWKRVLHRNIRPMVIWKLDTDDNTEIAAFKAKIDAAIEDQENMYIPKGTVEPEIVSTAQNATLNPLAWINQLNDYFFQAVNVPQIIIGNAKEFTDASGKIVYLSYEQAVKGEQLYVEEQILGQLNIELSLNFPASLQGDLLSGMAKDAKLQAASQNDTTAEIQGQK